MAKLCFWLLALLLASGSPSWSTVTSLFRLNVTELAAPFFCLWFCRAFRPEISLLSRYKQIFLCSPIIIFAASALVVFDWVKSETSSHSICTTLRRNFLFLRLWMNMLLLTCTYRLAVTTLVFILTTLWLDIGSAYVSLSVFLAAIVNSRIITHLYFRSANVVVEAGSKAHRIIRW